MCQEFDSPALRISNIVYGRRNPTGNRVEYLLDHTDPNSPYHIPEQIVLKRWKARDGSESGLRFSGFRLSPKIWKSLNFVFEADVQAMCDLNEDHLNEIFAKRSGDIEFKNQHFITITGDKLKRLTSALGPEMLHKLLERHNDPDYPERYGTPDLFLYAIKERDNKIDHFRFVEVKKPDEPLSSDQINELHFLNDELNVKARVLFLDEREL